MDAFEDDGAMIGTLNQAMGQNTFGDMDKKFTSSIFGAVEAL